ncbi:MAG TPA: hypothetical protein VGK74_02805 [Symbiobacteriaceae bacterium]|jgi:hypothetical protein
MKMRVVVNGTALSADVVPVAGVETAFVDTGAFLQALGVPTRGVQWGKVAVRKFCEVAHLRTRYAPPPEHVFYVGLPLPALPDAPVGADVQPWHMATPAIISQPEDRWPDLLNLVIQQFRVAQNPALLPREGNTYCNVFVWWCSRALGAEIPHWVTGVGSPARPGDADAWEMDANVTINWLRNYGAPAGWRKVLSGPALAAANAGQPAVVVWYRPGDIGHVAMVRPGAMTAKGVPIAQAGARNFDDGYLVDGFGTAAVGLVEYWVHD